MKNNALIVSEKDNVALAVNDIKKGQGLVVNGEQLFQVTEDVAAGHKIALGPIQVHERIFRYGEAIVRATRPIAKGEWVHVHNTEPIPGETAV